jgi:NAD(P)-dependent dehydrogenase (short-subunit alcohol dehydrogenase family)
MTSSTTQPLHGRHAVVTGGARGIGAAVARELAGLGAKVTITGRDRARLEAAGRDLAHDTGQPVHTTVLDLSDPASATRAFVDAREAFGGPYILVNNIGGVETTPFVKAAVEHWQRMLDVNLTSVFLACKEVLAVMKESGEGRIVNIASTAGVAGYRYVAAYCAAKHGVVGFTRALALEVAADGVTVNAVCPGYTDTEMLAESIDKVAATTGKSTEEVRRTFANANPQGNLITPEAVASAVAWLCLPEQTSITGQAIVVDGGETV